MISVHGGKLDEETNSWAGADLRHAGWPYEHDFRRLSLLRCPVLSLGLQQKLEFVNTSKETAAASAPT